MTGPEGAEAADAAEETLARLLESLGSPTRLALLRQLRSPRTLSEIRLRPEQTREGQNPDRAMTRQAVRGHIDRLRDSGFIRSREARRAGLPVEEFLVNHQQIFAVAEELRHLGERRPTDPTWDDATAPLPVMESGQRLLGPRLIVVHGLDEGRAFRLDGERAVEWVVGRRWGLAVTLDYDPFVSSEHSRVLREGDRYFVEDLPSSRNGTALNWTLLPKGGRAEVRHGDVIGVGKSLLLFRG